MHCSQFCHRNPVVGQECLPTTVTVDKAVHFKLHSAEDTGDLLVWHVFPRDIVSDLGPQFTFCGVLESRVSLSSGCHSQTNSRTERANRTLETPYNVWLLNTSHPGVGSCPGLYMPTTLCTGGSALSNWVTAGVCGDRSVVSSMCSSSQSQRQAWTPLLALYLIKSLPPPLSLINPLPLSALFSIVVIIKCSPVDCMFTN